MSASAQLDAASNARRRVLSAAASVAAAGVLVKFVAVFKEVAIASVYGRSNAMDAFLAALLIPNLLVNLISESMNQALIPTFIRVRERQGRAAAQQLLASAMLSTTLLLLAVSLLMALAAPLFFPLIASHYAPATLHLAIQLFYLLLPIVLFTGIATNCTAVLNTIDRFLVPALAPIVISLSIIAAACLCGARFGVWAIAWASLFGALLHAAWMALSLHRQGYPFRISWCGWNQPSREVAHQYGPILLSSIVASSGLLVDQSMAAMLSAGSVSALAYANRFVSVVVTLLAGAVSTAIVPYLSRLVAWRDWTACRQALRSGLRLTAAVSVPIAVALIAAAYPLIRLTLQHGAFRAADTRVVAPVLMLYAIQIPFFVCSRLFYRFLVALRRTDLIFYCGLLNLILDIVLNLLCMSWFGVAGIALATSLWTISTFLFLGYWTWKLLPAEATEPA